LQTNTAKYGAPIKDVIILIGSSEGSNILVKQSDNVNNIAPNNPLNMIVFKSFLFKIDLAICGGISPIKLISPVTLIILATTKVEKIKLNTCFFN